MAGHAPDALAHGLMVCGTASNAGKSTIVAGLCRLLARRGLRVAPFKAQNMALNSAVTSSGHEIGRAQFAQAQAAGVPAAVDMNPVLLKPTTDRDAQMIVAGRPLGAMSAADVVGDPRHSSLSGHASRALDTAPSSPLDEQRA